MTSGQDRRAHPRVSVDIDLDFECQHNLYVGRTRDLSMGGIFVETDVELPIGTHIDVRLNMFKKAFSLHCEIAWTLFDGSQCTGFGVRFLHLPAHIAKTLQAFMALRHPISYESDVEMIAASDVELISERDVEVIAASDVEMISESDVEMIADVAS